MSNTEFVKKCDSAQLAATNLRASIIGLESIANTSTILETEIAVAGHERDRHRVFLHSVGAQVQSLQTGFTDIVSIVVFSQPPLRDGTRPFFQEV